VSEFDHNVVKEWTERLEDECQQTPDVKFERFTFSKYADKHPSFPRMDRSGKNLDVQRHSQPLPTIKWRNRSYVDRPRACIYPEDDLSISGMLPMKTRPVPEHMQTAYRLLFHQVREAHSRLQFKLNDIEFQRLDDVKTQKQAHMSQLSTFIADKRAPEQERGGLPAAVEALLPRMNDLCSVATPLTAQFTATCRRCSILVKKRDAGEQFSEN